MYAHGEGRGAIEKVSRQARGGEWSVKRGGGALEQKFKVLESDTQL